MDVDLKSNRRYKRSTFTRLANALSRAVLKDKSLVDQLSAEVERAYNEFEAAHQEYHETIVGHDERHESDAYFSEVDVHYLQVLREQAYPVYSNCSADTKKERFALAQAFSMPRVEIETFDGEPTRYHSFMSLFDECVDKVTDDSQTKLTRLFQFTSGDAKDAIRSCVIVGGQRGYTEAR